MVCSIPRNCIEGFSVACDVPLLEHDHQIQSQWNCLILSPPILAPGWRTTVNNGKHLLCNGITVDYNHFEKPLSKRITGHAGMNEKHAKNIMWKMSQTYQNWFTRHTGSSCTGHQRVWFLLICLVTIEWCCSLADTLLGLGPCCLPWRTARYEGPSWRRASTRMWCKSLVPQHGYEWGTIPCTLWILWSLIPVLETLVIPVLTMKFAWSHQTWISSKHFQTGDEKHHLDVLISWDLSLSLHPFSLWLDASWAMHFCLEKAAASLLKSRCMSTAKISETLRPVGLETPTESTKTPTEIQSVPGNQLSWSHKWIQTCKRGRSQIWESFSRHSWAKN